MGWFSNFFKAVAAIVLPVIAFVAPEIIPAIGTALGATTPAAASTLGASAIQASTTLLAGGTPEQALKSGLTTAAGSLAADTLGAPAQYGTDVGSQQSQMLAAQEAGIPTVTKSALSGGASSATQAALQGKDPLTAGLKGAVIGAGAEYLSELAGQPGSLAADVTRQFSGQALSRALSDRGTTFTPTYTTTPTAPTSVTTTGAGQSPGSSALAQALRTDLGAPIFGGDKDKEGRKSGWNVESLRYMGDVGEA